MKYVAPEMNIVMFEAEEVIVASTTEVVTTTEQKTVDSEGDI